MNTRKLVLSLAFAVSALPLMAQDAPPAGPGGPPRGGMRGPQSGGGRNMSRGHEMGHDMGRGSPGMAGGMWWKDPEVVKGIELTADQTKRIDDIFTKSRLDLIHLRATLEENQLMLEPMLSANTLDTAKASAAIDKVADARAGLEKANAHMLLNARAVLSAAQWTKLHDMRGPGRRPGQGPAAQTGPQGQRPGSPAGGRGM